MGIPKLFRVLTERYPNLSQVVPANQLPQYDYLHIDLNNLIHKSYSERGSLPLEQLDDGYYLEERMFERIFCYIETLHRIIPSKVLFLSMDGVAPRAKWATQRERRVRKIALETEFDSNQISPGTKFMINFETALMEYVRNRIKHHSNWQNCEIYVNGSNCPGEGSVKIVHFIRSLKLSSTVPNETHCIYSGDNDCLLLGIATKELYISLVQEKKRSASSLGSLCLNDTKHQFEVIHFETLRQYLRMEFFECQSKMSFEFDMDHICDDWVVLMTLVGNDYVPGLPNFHLDHNVLEMIYEAYKNVLSSSNGYMNESGFLNLRRFARLIQNLNRKDFDLYRIDRKNVLDLVTDKLSDMHLNNNNNRNVDETKSSEQRSEQRFMEMKCQYYALYLDDRKKPEYVQMSVDYVKMIQWTLFYYYRDACSWNEYYQYDCVPFVSDMVDIHKADVVLEFDKPTNALTHLLAILPMRSAHLLPRSYRMEMFDDFKIPCWEDLMIKSNRAEMKLPPEDAQRNTERPMMKLQYDGFEKSSNCVKVTEVFIEKKTEAAYKATVHRPFNRQDFNFQFSTLNLHDYSCKLLEPSITKPYARWLICLKVNEPCTDVVGASEKFLDRSVYVNWPHYAEAKVTQIFDANKKIWLSNNVTKTMDNPSEFHASVEQVKSRYRECGIDVGEIKMLAYVAQLKWIEHKPSETMPNAYELVKHWEDNKWEPVALQTLIPSCMPVKGPQFKLVNDLLRGRSVVLFGNKSYYYGETATVVDIQNLETNGRVNILAFMDPLPCFEDVIRVHTEAKTTELNQFKQPSTAATLLGIHEKVFSRVTGTVLVSPANATDTIRKINIGLQMKVRGVYQSGMTVLPQYVKQNGKQFVYSQSAIDLVQQYMNKFPRVFELLNSDEKAITTTDLECPNNNGKQSGLECLSEIRTWLQSLPLSKTKRSSLETMQLSDNAIKGVQVAVRNALNADEGKELRLKMKWQNLYIPDLNSIFAVPCPSASYKLLDRVMVVRSGYPVSVGTKGTVIAIEPMRNFIALRGAKITDDELYTLDILMDHPYKAPLAARDYQRHKIFRTRSTNMLINISHGRDD